MKHKADDTSFKYAYSTSINKTMSLRLFLVAKVLYVFSYNGSFAVQRHFLGGGGTKATAV